MVNRSMDHLNILLIDDDEDDYVNLKDIFQEINGTKYDLTWKSNYKDGLTAIKENSYDVCLLDYRLGEHTGLELLGEVQKMGIYCPIIFLTGHGDMELDLRAMQAGAADYLVKTQINSPLLERSVRYAIKNAFDVQELKKSQAQILQQDRLASLGLLASSLAHEIGTPLGVIRGRAELLAYGKVSEEEVKNTMELIISQIDRISKLVKSLLNLARGNQSEFASAVSVNEVIDDIRSLIRHELDLKNIKLELLVPEKTIVKAEAGPLGQVLLNLLVNSVHAIEEAKKINPTKQHKIEVSVKDLGTTVEMKVTDTGCGISEANLSKLFQPFFTTKDIGLGSGLGLATSLKIVHSWGGNIDVDTRLDSGSIFTVSLRKF